MDRLIPWIAIGLLVALLVWMLVPVIYVRRFSLNEGKEKAEVEDSYRKTVGQAIGALAIIATFFWTFTKDNDTIDQTRQQIRQTHDQFLQQQTQARRQFANQQFIAAASLLKETSVGPRVAGLYGLQEIASDQPEYRLPTIFAALALIKSPGSLPLEYLKDNDWPSIGADIQSAIVIVSALNSDRRIEVNLNETYLVRADFSSQRSTSAFAKGSFQGAKLYGANFSGLNLRGTKFDGSYLADWEAYGARWLGLTVRDYENTRWRYIVNFTGAQLTDAGFDNANIGGGMFNNSCLGSARFWKSDLSRASFKDASLGLTETCDPNGRKAHFYEATLIDANFEGVDLSGVSFERANLTRTHFAKALNVEKAKFTGACGNDTEFPPASQVRLRRCNDN